MKKKKKGFVPLGSTLFFISIMKSVNLGRGESLKTLFKKRKKTFKKVKKILLLFQKKFWFIKKGVSHRNGISFGDLKY